MRVHLQKLLRSPRARIAGALALGLLAALFVGAHLLLNSASMAQRVHARVEEKLTGRIGPCSLGERFEVSWLGEARLGPFLIPGDDSGPLLEVGEIRVRPRLGALLLGKLEPARVTLAEVKLRVDPKGARLEALLRRLRGPRKGGGEVKSGASEALPVLVLEGVRVELERESGQVAQLGPIDARVNLSATESSRSLDARIRIAPRGKARVEATMDARGLRLTGVAESLPLERLLPGVAGLEVLKGFASGTVELDKPHGAPARARVDGQVVELTVQGERLATEPVGPTRAAFLGSVTFDRQARQVGFEDAHLFLGEGKVELPFEATLGLAPEPHFSVDARLGPVDLAAVMEALPPQLRPSDAVPRVDGPLRAEVRAEGPVAHPDAWTVGVKLDTSGIKQRARTAPFDLREPFKYTPQDQAGTDRTLWVGEKNPSFVPIDQLPPIVAAAVTTSEDGSFYVHNGFDFDELRDSFASVATGTRFRGGSTLTQQLVKNVYLSRERTLARKIREALITVEVEAALPKSRILEIYLNIIEWGPGVYGIGEAARYYFGVDARQLTVKQAVFLATVIPSPTRWGPYFKRHGPTEHWNARMADLLAKLAERNAITAEQQQRALAEPLNFRAEPAPHPR